MRITPKVVMQNDGDFVDVILIFAIAKLTVVTCCHYYQGEFQY